MQSDHTSDLATRSVLTDAEASAPIELDISLLSEVSGGRAPNSSWVVAHGDAPNSSW